MSRVNRSQRYCLRSSSSLRLRLLLSAFAIACQISVGGAQASGGPAAQQSTTTLPYAATFEVLNTPLSGGEIQLRVLLIPSRELHRLSLSFQSQGIVSLTTALDEALTDVPANVPVVLEGTIDLLAAGEGSLLLRTSLYEDAGCGETLHVAHTFGFFVLDDGLTVRTGGGSVLELRLVRLQELLDAGLITMDDAAVEFDRLIGAKSLEGDATLTMPPQSLATGDVNITGSAMWTDINGGQHPARSVRVRVYRPGFLFGLSEVASTTTDTNGGFSFSLSPGDLGSSPRDLTIRVFTENYAAKVSQAVLFLFGGSPYYQERVFRNVADGAAIANATFTGGRTEVAHQAFSVADAAIVGSDYIQAVQGSRPSRIDILFPRAGTSTGSAYMPLLNNIEINGMAPYAWDVLLHEYGHYLADIFNLDDSPGGDHLCDDDLIARYGKNDGSRLAWGEGLATYLGIAAQAITGASALNVPYVGDAFYDDVEIGSPRWGYDEETRDDCVAIGEGSETNVSRSLWDVADAAADVDDRMSLGHAAVWSVIRAAGSHDNLSDVWNALISGRPRTEIDLLGKVFAQNTVAPQQTNPADGAGFTSTPPTFTWHKNNLDSFQVRFYDQSFNEIGASLDLGDQSSWIPSQSEWDTIRMTTGTIKWVVEGRNTESPETGRYWSGSRRLGGTDFAFVIDDTGSMSQEIGGVRSALLNFLSMFDPTSTALQFQLTTFKDNVTVRTPTRSLGTIQAQVSALQATGGGDCPEESVRGLAQGTLGIKKGGTVLFATDADPRPGSDLASLITQLRSDGARVNVLLSGTCSGGFLTATGDPSAEEAALSSATVEQCSDTASDTEDPGCSSGGITAGFSLASLNAIDAFSQVATATGGTFAFIPEVNSGGTGATKYQNAAQNILQASIGPRVVLVAPSRVRRGAVGALTIHGQNTNFLSTSTVSFGPGVSILGVSPLDAVTLTVDIQVDPSASLGFHDIVVETQLSSTTTETAQGVGVLTVEASTTVPLLSTTRPAVARRGETLEVEVAGLNTHFNQTQSIASFGSGISVMQLDILSPTNARAILAVDSSAAIGFRNVRITTGSEIAQNEVLGFFRVEDVAPSIPLVTSINPNHGETGRTLQVSILVSGITLTPGATIVEFSGSGITVDTVVVCGTTVGGSITIAPNAPPGARDVIVRSAGASAVALNAFTVEARTNQPPTISCARPSVATDPGKCTAALDCGTVADCSDPDGDPVTFSCDPAGPYSPGLNNVTVRCDDGEDTATALCEVSVLDRTPPSLALTTRPDVLWPPNHRMIPVQVAAVVEDLCDPSPAIALVSVVSSEPDDGQGNGDGNTSDDIGGAELGTADQDVMLRAERDGSGLGRTYELTYTAVDSSGNVTPAFAVVTVPHDQGSGPEALLLRLEPTAGAEAARLYWSSVPGAATYDLISGEVENLGLENNRIYLGPVRVLARGLSVTSWTEVATDPVPAPGQAFFYLAQYHDTRGKSGFGTVSVPWPREPLSCDGGCP